MGQEDVTLVHKHGGEGGILPGQLSKRIVQQVPVLAWLDILLGDRVIVTQNVQRQLQLLPGPQGADGPLESDVDGPVPELDDAAAQLLRLLNPPSRAMPSFLVSQVTPSRGGAQFWTTASGLGTWLT